MKITQHGHVYYDPTAWVDSPEEHFGFRTWGPDIEFTKTHVCEATISFEIPDNFDPRPTQIAKLRERIEKARADFTARQTELLRQIAELEALPFEEVQNGNG